MHAIGLCANTNANMSNQVKIPHEYITYVYALCCFYTLKFLCSHLRVFVYV